MGVPLKHFPIWNVRMLHSAMVCVYCIIILLIIYVVSAVQCSYVCPGTYVHVCACDLEMESASTSIYIPTNLLGISQASRSSPHNVPPHSTLAVIHLTVPHLVWDTLFQQILGFTRQSIASVVQSAA